MTHIYAQHVVNDIYEAWFVGDQNKKLLGIAIQVLTSFEYPAKQCISIIEYEIP